MVDLTNTANIFNETFSQAHIAEVYERSVSWRYLPSIDRMSSAHFNDQKSEHFKIIREKCLNGSYNFSPYLERLYFRGRNRNPRVISIATIRDRIVLSLLKDYLHRVFPECVNRKLPNSYISEIKRFYETNIIPDLCIYKLDIESFYDSIDHKKLLDILTEKIKSKQELVLLKHAIDTLTVPFDYKRADLKQKKI
jgi:retron-type reverse transcriptase